MNSLINSSNSYELYRSMTLKNSAKNSRAKRCESITKIIIILITIGLIIYIFIDYNNFNKLISDELYKKILNNYDKIYLYSDFIDYLPNYNVFLFFFIIGFCLWNIYKSFIFILGFFITELIVFNLKLVFRKEPQIFNIEFDKKILSSKSINSICEFTSEYECPSYRAAYVVYTYMSFICLLFKEKKLRNKKILKLCLKIFFILICTFINISLLFLLQNTLGSIIIGSGIGFIFYFFMFRFLKIDYDRSEQMISIINFNIIYYILINLFIIGIILSFYFFLGEDEENKIKFLNLCGDTYFKFKEMELETIFKSLFFFCNFTMIICIKLQKKYIFLSDGIFISRNFNVEEITDENNLTAHIHQNESFKIDTNNIVKYLCKIFICLGIAFFCLLIYQIIKYFRDENYVILSFMTYLIPTNLLIIFLFFFSKWLFIYLDLEVNSYSI